MIGIHSLSKLRLRWVGFVLACATMTGCIEINGVHYVNPPGDTDTGGYMIGMDTLVYLSMLNDDPKFLNGLRKLSRPSISQRGDRTYISDRTGEAMMERFYDKVSCTPARDGWSDCSYAMRQAGWNFLGWSLDWKVVLPRDWKVIDANNDRRIVAGGQQELLWYFDGDRVNSFNVHFTVRVPNA